MGKDRLWNCHLTLFFIFSLFFYVVHLFSGPVITQLVLCNNATIISNCRISLVYIVWLFSYHVGSFYIRISLGLTTSTFSRSMPSIYKTHDTLIKYQEIKFFLTLFLSLWFLFKSQPNAKPRRCWISGLVFNTVQYFWHLKSFWDYILRFLLSTLV